MTGTIDIMCAVPAPTLEQVRAWLTREGWMLSVRLRESPVRKR